MSFCGGGCEDTNPGMQNIFYRFRHYPVAFELLPYLDSSNLYNQFNLNLAGTPPPPPDPRRPDQRQLAPGPLKVFLCPSMPAPLNPVFADYASYGWNRGNCDIRSPAQAGDIFKPGRRYGFTPSDGVFISRMDAGLDFATGQAWRAVKPGGPRPDPTGGSPTTRTGSTQSITDGLSNTIAAGEMHNILKGYTTTTVNSVSVGTTAVRRRRPDRLGVQRRRLLQRGTHHRADEHAHRPVLRPLVTITAPAQHPLQQPALFVPQHAHRRLQLPVLRRDREVPQPDHQHDPLQGARQPQRRRGR